MVAVTTRSVVVVVVMMVVVVVAESSWSVHSLRELGCFQKAATLQHSSPKKDSLGTKLTCIGVSDQIKRDLKYRWQSLPKSWKVPEHSYYG